MSKRILVIEDHADIQQLIQMSLEVGNFEIFEAADANERLQSLQILRPQILLLDIMMPGSIDGLEVCRIAKNVSDPPTTSSHRASERGSYVSM